MKLTKSLLFTLTTLVLGRPFGHGQVIVHDPANATIALTNHVAEILKMIAMIKELETTKDWLGNAGKIVDLAGLNEVFANLESAGVGQSRVDLARSATSAEGTTYDGDGMYTPVGQTFESRSGQTITRPDVFRPEAAIFQAVRDYDAVHEDVKLRREALRTGRAQTTAQLQAATTHAETLKATGVLLAQQIEQQVTDREPEFAAQKAILLDIQNRADQERQEKAHLQEQAREFNEALLLFVQMVTPPRFGAPSQPTSSSRPITSQESPGYSTP